MLIKEEGYSTYTVGTANLVLCFSPFPSMIGSTIMCRKLTDCKNLILSYTYIKIILQYYAKYGTQQM